MKARVVVVALGLFVATLSACSPGRAAPTAGASPPRGDRSSLSTPAADPLTAAKDGALAAYRGMWRAYLEASRIPDPTGGQLATYASGGALSVWRKGLSDLAARGLASRGDVVLRPSVVGVQPADRPTTVDIADCVDTSHTALYKLSGADYRDSPGGRRRTTASAQRDTKGVWTVTAIAIYGVGTC